MLWRALSAQQFAGTFRGTVQDSSGGVIPGAEVRIMDAATNETSTVITDGEGRYVVPQLKPGSYNVTVTLSGFKTTVINDLKDDVQQICCFDVTLEVATTTAPQSP